MDQQNTPTVDLDEYPWLSLGIKSQVTVGNDEEPDSCIQNYHCSILGGPKQNVELGWLRFFKVDYWRIDSAGHALHDAFDQHSQLMADYFAMLYEDGNEPEFSKKVLKASEGEGVERDVLILDYLLVYPEFRGHDVGLKAMYEVIQRYSSGCGVVIGQAVPLQFGSLGPGVPDDKAEIGFDQAEMSKHVATKKLIRHYGRLGFKQIPGSSYIVLAPDRHQPTWNDIFPELEAQ